MRCLPVHAFCQRSIQGPSYSLKYRALSLGLQWAVQATVSAASQWLTHGTGMPWRHHEHSRCMPTMHGTWGSLVHASDSEPQLTEFTACEGSTRCLPRTNHLTTPAGVAWQDGHLLANRSQGKEHLSIPHTSQHHSSCCSRVLLSYSLLEHAHARSLKVPQVRVPYACTGLMYPSGVGCSASQLHTHDAQHVTGQNMTPLTGRDHTVRIQAMLKPPGSGQSASYSV